MTEIKKTACKLLGSLATVFFASTTAHASGFALNEQSAASVGMALAGTGVEDDASVQFSNPAGISGLKGFNALGGGNIYFTDAEFKNHGSTSPGGLTPLTGNATSNPTVAAPEGFVAYTMDNGISLGLGVYAPYGLATYYPDTGATRYFGQSSDLRTIEINPNIAYKISNDFSLGAGPEIRHTRGEFSQAEDFGADVFARGAPVVAPFGPGALAALAAATGPGGANDLRIHAVGDDWSAGFKAGALWAPDNLTKIGVAYHSAMESTLTGTATVDSSGLSSAVDRAAFAASGIPTAASVTAKIDYPQNAILSASRKLDDKLTLDGDFEWTQWSRFKDLSIQGMGAAGAAFNATTVENWQDGYRFSIGAEYAVAPQWKLRGGVAYDTNPISSDSTRTPRVPDGDRTWLSVGAGYAFTENLTLDVGFAYLFFNDEGIVNSSTSQGTLVGDYEGNNAQILSADIAYHF